MTSALVTEIIRISRNVVDLERSTLFYRDRLDFQLSGPAFYMDRLLAAELGLGACNVKVQRLSLGNEELELVEAGPNARPYPSPSSSADLAFQHLALRCANIDIALKRLYREDSASARPTVKRNLKLIQLRTQTQLEINTPTHAVIGWVLPPLNCVCV